MKYYINKILNTDFDIAVNKTREALKSEGFGILSEINIHEKLKEKLDVNFRKYKILGACNPPLAYQALQKENKIYPPEAGSEEASKAGYTTTSVEAPYHLVSHFPQGAFRVFHHEFPVYNKPERIHFAVFCQPGNLL